LCSAITLAKMSPVGQIIWPMNVKVARLTAIAVAALTAPAFAHHWFAMFDAGQTLTFQGTVNEWRNPHAWLRVMFNDEKAGGAQRNPEKTSGLLRGNGIEQQADPRRAAVCDADALH
jgi:hypothetical protein